MLRSRIIPCLLVSNRGLVKTVRFGTPKYVGDPINAVRIFNEKEVDELVILDIDATLKGVEPDYDMIRAVAAECRMPLCYGGGVKTLQHALKIIRMGVEKVALSSMAVDNPAGVAAIAKYVGRQSVVAILDVKRDPLTGKYEVWTHNATRNSHKDPVAFATQLAELGAGEITINSIDREGMMNGYDMELAAAVLSAVSVPTTILGGAGSLDDIELLIRRFGIIGAAAGSLFVFKGKYRAVLINYPNRMLKEAVCAGAMEKADA